MISHSRKVLFVWCLIMMCSCGRERNPGEDVGCCLLFSHSPSDTVILKTNCYLAEPEVNMDCPDLLVDVLAYGSLKDSGSKYYYSAADKDIENNLYIFMIKTTGESFNGVIPVTVEYRTEVCAGLRIEMYRKDGLFMSDVTDLARFHYVYDRFSLDESAQNILIASDGKSDHKSVSKIDIGSSVKDYLSFNPFVFAHAHFIFPELKKDIFDNGNYLKVEIRLAGGKILTARSSP